MSERLLRFVVLEPPYEQESAFVILLAFNTQPTAFVPELRRLINVAEALPANIYAFIRGWLDNANAASPETWVPFHSQFSSFGDALNRNRFMSFEQLQELIEATFGQTAVELLGNGQFSNVRNKLGEIIVGLTNIQDYEQGLLVGYSKLYISQELIRKVANNDQSMSGRRIRKFLRSIIKIPEDLLVSRMSRDGSGITEAPLPENEEENNKISSRLERQKELNKSIEEHHWAINELESLGSYDFRFLSDSDAITRSLSQPGGGGNNDNANTILGGEANDDPLSADVVNERPATEHMEENNTTTSNVSRPRRRSTIMAIAPTSLNRLSHSTRHLLQSLEVDPTTRPHEEIIDRIRFKLLSLKGELSRLKDSHNNRPSGSSMRIGSLTVPSFTNNSSSSPFGGIANSTDFVGPSVPQTVGLIEPTGIGILYVVKQQIQRYEAGEIAHIENILKSELRERETRRLTRSEQTITEETETTTEEERDLQTTERLSMKKETEEIVKEDETFKIGASLSAGYGPFIQIGVNTEYVTNTSRETTTRVAQEYAKEITERAATKLTERVREERITKILEEFEEKNKHEFRNNFADSEHIVGLYQWIDKVYVEQVFNYGVRLFFDIMIPEPALLYLKSLDFLYEKNASKIEEPESFDITPDEIKLDTYQELVHKYRASGVEAPPKSRVSVSTTFDFTTDKDLEYEKIKELKTNDEKASYIGRQARPYVKSRNLNIPEGYRVRRARIQMIGRPHGIDYALEGEEGGLRFYTDIRIVVGNKVLSAQEEQKVPGSLWPFQVDHFVGEFELEDLNQSGSIPVGITADNIENAVVTIDLVCERTGHAIQVWQLKTYDTLLQAHLRQKSEYEEKIAELETRQGVQIQGNNPLQNRLIERNELKRSAISMISGQHFNLFDTGALVHPADIIFSEAVDEGRYVRFFELAFEWDKMQYEFYPYYWGPKKRWPYRLTKYFKDDNDPQFTEFLNCAYCHVRIPVTPEFEEAVLNYLQGNGIIPNEESPALNSKYSELMSRLLERRELEEVEEEGEEEEGEGEEHPDDVTSIEDFIPDTGIPIEPAWEIKLPTSLVKLRAPGFSASLPSWKKDANDRWVPEDNQG
jgi:hypothetical protein